MRRFGRPGEGERRLGAELALTVVVLVAVILLVRQAGTPPPSRAAGNPRPSPKRRSPASPSASPAGPSAGSSGPSSTPARGCKDLSAWLCEDFDSTPAGSVPPGWVRTGPVAVTAARAHSGRHALEAGLVPRGARTITLDLAWLGTRAGEQWGRIYFEVGSPAPYSATRILHSTMVGERADSPLHHDPIEVRPVGIEGSHDGRPDFQFLYNVQPLPGSKRHEFATLSPFDWSYDNSWHCAEWHLSSATQSYAFYIDGREVTSIGLHNGPGHFAGTEIPPAYQSITIGWTNYRSAAVGGSRGFRAWLDDFALGATRIGCA